MGLKAPNEAQRGEAPEHRGTGVCGGCDLLSLGVRGCKSFEILHENVHILVLFGVVYPG